MTRVSHSWSHQERGGEAKDEEGGEAKDEEGEEEEVQQEEKVAVTKGFVRGKMSICLAE